MPLTPERWLLEARFSTIQETDAAGAYEGGPGEAAEFYEYCRKMAEDEWGFLSEEIHEGVERDGETVRVSLSLIDPFGDLFRWIISRTSPESVMLRRTEPR